jgi:hypothetical protein
MDPSNDVHCSVLASYYDGLAKATNAPADQRRAMAALLLWYGGKAQRIDAERRDGSVLQEIKSVLTAIKKDPMAATDELTACADRATKDPGFEVFARS